MKITVFGAGGWGTALASILSDKHDAVTLYVRNAELAQDLRREIRGMIKDGKSDQEIIDFMVIRYGDFVLYQPPLQPGTWLLWGGPLLVLGAGALVVVGIVRRRARTVAAAPPTSADVGEDW